MGIAVLLPLKSFGSEQPASQTQQSDVLDSIDAPRDYLSAQIASFANYIDRFFGGDRHYQESNQSVVQLDLTRATGYGADRKYDLVSQGQFKTARNRGTVASVTGIRSRANYGSVNAKFDLA